MHTQQLSTELVQELAQHYEYPAISILMPTHKVSTPPHLQEDSIRLKNNIKEVIDLTTSGDGESLLDTDIKNHLKELHEDHDFLKHQSTGLGLFISKNSIVAIRLPHTVENHVVVNHRFHISPLLATIQENKDYYVLQLSDNNPRILKGDFYSIEELDFSLPRSRKEALNIDEFEQEIQFHSGEGHGRAMYHAHAGDKDNENNEQRNYYRVLERLIKPHTDQNLPIILAGTKRDITMFKDISKLSNIHEDAITHSIEHKKLEQIHDSVREIIQTWNTDEAYQARTQFKQLIAANSKKAIYDLNKIKKAAAEGRIAKLLIRMKQVTKDTVQTGMTSHTVIGHDGIDPEPLDEITMSTWSQKGEIFGLDATLMPTTSPLAAILRY